MNLLSNRLEDEKRKHAGGESRNFATRMVEYLSNIDDETLIFEFSRPIFDFDSALALQVFTSPDAEKRVLLDPRRVLAHLKSCSVGLREDTLVISYLERLIESRNDVHVDLHNELVHQYVERVMHHDENKYVMLRNETSESRKSLRTRLMIFLKSENGKFDAQQMLQEFPPMRLLEERALLLRKLGLHDRALHIYVHKLDSMELAEEYCNDVYEKYEDVYITLVRTYLRKPPKNDALGEKEDDEKRRIKDAIDLLCKYYDRVDPTKALALLPLGTKITELRKYLKLMFSKRDHVRRTIPIEKEFRKLECLRLQEELCKLKSRSFVLTGKEKCVRCGKSICVDKKNVSFSLLTNRRGREDEGVVLDDMPFSVMHFRGICTECS